MQKLTVAASLLAHVFPELLCCLKTRLRPERSPRIGGAMQWDAPWRKQRGGAEAQNGRLAPPERSTPTPKVKETTALRA